MFGGFGNSVVCVCSYFLQDGVYERVGEPTEAALRVLVEKLGTVLNIILYVSTFSHILY